MAFAFPGDVSSAVQPSVDGDRVFVGSPRGRVFALSLRDGCAYWAFDAGAMVRTAVEIGDAGGSRLAFFGDVAANVFAVDVATGVLRWKTKVETHRAARVTGTPKFYRGRLYVPVSSIEEVTGASPKYECCTFRGSVVALDAATGTQAWKTYVITEEPIARRKNAEGTQLYGPSGAAIWSAPTINLQGMTPNGAAGGGLFALRLADGKKAWHAPIPGCGDRPKCSPAQSAPTSVIDGVVFSGSVDGHLRGYSTRDGHIVWDMDTTQEVTTVNGSKAHGGSIDVGGPAIANGVVLTTSGYAQWGGQRQDIFGDSRLAAQVGAGGCTSARRTPGRDSRCAVRRSRGGRVASAGWPSRIAAVRGRAAVSRPSLPAPQRARARTTRTQEVCPDVRIRGYQGVHAGAVRPFVRRPGGGRGGLVSAR